MDDGRSDREVHQCDETIGGRRSLIKAPVHRDRQPRAAWGGPCGDGSQRHEVVRCRRSTHLDRQCQWRRRRNLAIRRLDHALVGRSALTNRLARLRLTTGSPVTLGTATIGAAATCDCGALIDRIDCFDRRQRADTGNKRYVGEQRRGRRCHDYESPADSAKPPHVGHYGFEMPDSSIARRDIACILHTAGIDSGASSRRLPCDSTDTVSLYSAR